MRIGLYDVDSKIPNLALMKVSAYHKGKGDQVEWYSPLIHEVYDKVYASMIFTNSDDGYLRNDMVIGGSGYDLHVKLSHEIEHMYPDYELYGCEYAMGFMTRGCIRKCPFCIVPEKEGRIRFNARLEEFCRDQNEVMLLDNNFLAYEGHYVLLRELIDSDKRIDFNQGLDIRLIDGNNTKLLREMRIWKQLRFAFDDYQLKSLIDKKLKLLNDVGFRNKEFRFYVLIGFDSTYEEDVLRIEFLQEKGCDIFVMPYCKNDYTVKMTRWVNRFFYKYESFSKYCERFKDD